MEYFYLKSLLGTIKVHQTCDHPDSHYNLPVWVDDDNVAYCQVGLEMMSGYVLSPYQD